MIFNQGAKRRVSGHFNKAKPMLTNDSIQYTLPGSVNGYQGVFEIFTRPSLSERTELITHRFFRPLS